jgi:hypothetical protein
MTNRNVAPARRSRQCPRRTSDSHQKLTVESRRLYLAAHFSFFLRELNHGRLIRASDLTALVPFAATDSENPGPLQFATLADRERQDVPGDRSDQEWWARLAEAGA